MDAASETYGRLQEEPSSAPLRSSQLQRMMDAIVRFRTALFRRLT